MICELDLKNLRVLDEGRLDAAFAQELKHVVLDLMDRPGDDRARTVGMMVKFKPICDESGQCESVNVQVEISSKLPNRKSKVYDMRARKSAKGPMLVFHEESLDSFDQTTIFDNSPEDKD